MYFHGHSMDERFVRQIVLEIIDRIGFDHNRTKKSIDLTSFHAQDIACAFLRQFQGENLVKTQKVREYVDQKQKYNLEFS